ncbi:MAG: hypothetical protein CR981_04615, partial [Proteobacteria bacterium]
MKIKWALNKKRGNFRPTLRYVITLEDFEKSLAMDAVSVRSTIPRINDSSRTWCLPGCDERHPDWKPTGFHRLSVPYFKTGISEDFIRLPFRESGEYPEIEYSFSLLRERYETVVAETYRWGPIREERELGLTEETREKIAATLTARKML